MSVGASTQPYAAAPAPAVETPVDEEAIRAHLPLVRRVVRRLAFRRAPGVSFEDLVAWGLAGLVEALQRFDPARRARFESYAQMRIRGAILDRLRAEDWAARSARVREHQVERAYQEVEAREGRPATEEEVASHLGIPLAEFRDLLLAMGRQGFLSLEDVGLDLEQVPSDQAWSADPAERILGRERIQRVGAAIARLPEKEQTVIAAYYHEGLTMREVGALLGLTESRVSQLHSQALLRLRGALSDGELGSGARGAGPSGGTAAGRKQRKAARGRTGEA